MAYSALFDRPTVSPLGSAFQWVGSFFQNDAAISLCVIAVALLGYTMLMGRWPIRRAALVIIGCFVLLGAPLIAGDILGGAQVTDASPQVQASGVLYQRADLPPADYDPYAGASLIR
jgi:type IV secretion system protein VirB2